MEQGVFQPKAFYRKLDALLARIGEKPSMKEMLQLVLDELIISVGGNLGIKSGCVYRRSGAWFRKTGQLGGSEEKTWPDRISGEEEAIELLNRHKNYIFVDTVVPPWGQNSVAVLLSEDDEYMLVVSLWLPPCDTAATGCDDWSDNSRVSGFRLCFDPDPL